MATVKAIHEIVRPSGVIRPMDTFESTGQELSDLLRLGAVKKVSEDSVDESQDSAAEKVAAEKAAAEKVAAEKAAAPKKAAQKKADPKNEDGLV